jgi:hypothetical protein
MILYKYIKTYALNVRLIRYTPQGITYKQYAVAQKK